MSTAADSEASLKMLFESLKALEVESESRLTTCNDVVVLQEENLKLKEKNICLEKKVSELQTKLDRLAAHYQSIILSGQELKNVEDMVLKSMPKHLEDDNAALTDIIAQMEVKLFHASEENREHQESREFHQYKMDRLIDLMGEVMSRQVGLEKQLSSLSAVCDRIRPAAQAVAQQSASLQLSHQHQQCQVNQLAGRLAEQRHRAAVAAAQLEATRARLRTLEGEAAGLRAAEQEHQTETAQAKMEAAELQDKLEDLQKRLEDAQDTIQEQSELLSRMYAE